MKIKKVSFLIVLVLVSFSINAQFYISGSGGYSFKAQQKVLGDKVTEQGVSDLKGSFGTGIEAQLRAGYLINDKLGLELGIGYLNGANNDINQILSSSSSLQGNVIGRGEAFGASLSGVYNFTKNIYVRAGLLTKVGGKTITEGDVTAKDIPLFLLNPSITNLGVVDDLNMQFTTDFYGKLPFGAITAAGYKFGVSDNLQLFAEVEYMGINVSRDKSRLDNFSGTIAGENVTRDQVVEFMTALVNLPITPQPTKEAITDFLPLLQDEVQWGEGGLPSSKAPYSSLGFNIGLTYIFGK